jgi:hypothetical protein
VGEFLEQPFKDWQPGNERLSGDFLKLVGAVSCQPLRGLNLSQPLRTAVQVRIRCSMVKWCGFMMCV